MQSLSRRLIVGITIVDYLMRDLKMAMVVPIRMVTIIAIVPMVESTFAIGNIRTTSMFTIYPHELDY